MCFIQDVGKEVIEIDVSGHLKPVSTFCLCFYYFGVWLWFVLSILWVGLKRLGKGVYLAGVVLFGVGGAFSCLGVKIA